MKNYFWFTIPIVVIVLLSGFANTSESDESKIAIICNECTLSAEEKTEISDSIRESLVAAERKMKMELNISRVQFTLDEKNALSFRAVASGRFLDGTAQIKNGDMVAAATEAAIVAIRDMQ